MIIQEAYGNILAEQHKAKELLKKLNEQLKKLDNEYLTKKYALEIIHYRCKEISGEIDYLSENADLRDNISRKIVRSLYDLCYLFVSGLRIKKEHTPI